MGITVGIDLGTTNSAIAVRKITTSVLHNQDGEALTPSCVTIIPGTKGEKIVVGRGAKDLLKQYPESTVLSVKRLMGRRFDDPEVQKAIRERRYPYLIEAGADQLGSIKLRLDTETFTPEAISALILRKIAADGARDSGDVIESAVVTVPAYFSDRQKFATRSACDQAGLPLLRLLPEPTAAAIAFGLEEMAPDEAKTVMVFDLGGGTFDVSVLSIVGGQFMEVSKGGDMWLGGDDIDQLISTHVFEAAEKAATCGPIPDLIDRLDSAAQARFRAEMRESCERAKIELSTADSATIEQFGVLRDAHGKLVDIDVTLTRAEFDVLLAPMLGRLVAITEAILKDINFEPELIDAVLMVGGSSLIPAVQAALRQKFGAAKVRVHERPMFAVVEGAAIMAHRLAGRSEAAEGTEVNLMHAVAHNYYLQLAEGRRHLVVPRNAPLPYRSEHRLVFKEAHQELARLRLFDEVDQVLEPIGEHWFYRERGDLLEFKKSNQKKVELILGIEIDEDNIIKMQSWPADQPQSQEEVIISRGGPASKLFSDLEHLLAQISATEKSAAWNFILLSKIVKATILRTTDPRTTKIDLAEEQLALTQMDTLRVLASRECYAVRVHSDALDLINFALAGFTRADQEALRASTAKLEADLRLLQDPLAIVAGADRIEAIVEEDEYGDVIEDAAGIIQHLPSHARRLRGLVAALGAARETDSAAAIAEAGEALTAATEEFIKDYDTSPSGHFARDVELASP